MSKPEKAVLLITSIAMLLFSCTEPNEELDAVIDEVLIGSWKFHQGVEQERESTSQDFEIVHTYQDPLSVTFNADGTGSIYYYKSTNFSEILLEGTLEVTTHDDSLIWDFAWGSEGESGREWYRYEVIADTLNLFNHSDLGRYDRYFVKF